jgi:1,4-dihydroxy-2-naphthoate octaprenyltransferase
MGLFACALLGANNLRDLDGDAASGKRTIAVRLGRRDAGRWYATLLAGGFAAAAGCASWRLGSLAVLAAAPLTIAPIRAALGDATGASLLGVLARTARVQLVAGALLAVGLWVTS